MCTGAVVPKENRQMYDFKGPIIGIIPVAITIWAIRFLVAHVKANRPYSETTSFENYLSFYTGALIVTSSIISVVLLMIIVEAGILSFAMNHLIYVGHIGMLLAVLSAVFIEWLIKSGFKSKSATTSSLIGKMGPLPPLWGVVKSPLTILSAILFFSFVFWLVEGQEPSSKVKGAKLIPLLFGQFDRPYGYLFFLNCMYCFVVYLSIYGFVVSLSRRYSSFKSSKSKKSSADTEEN